VSFLGQDEQIREYQFRFRYLYIALFAAFIILIARLWYLQIISGDKFRQYSEENRIKRVKIPSPRGMIFDRNKKLLVDNRPAFDLEITPQELYADKEWKLTVARLSKMTKIPVDEILKTLAAGKGQPRFLPIKIKQDLSNEEVAIVEAHKLDLPGVNIQMEIKRTNLYNDLAAHLMGYIGEVNQADLIRLNKALAPGAVPYKMGDSTGKFGLEARWEHTLRGIDGEEYIEVDALGRRKKITKGLATELKAKPSVPGQNLVLTIDQDLQIKAAEQLNKLHGEMKIGAVIALNPKNGEILAAVSQPSFDPTLFSRGVSTKVWNELLNNEFHPLRDKTLQDHYSPGSTFKVVTAIAGLEEKEIDENTTVHCPGSYRLGNRTYRCHKRSGHGIVNLSSAIAVSCDVYFYRLGQKLGIDRIAKYAKMLGLGRKSGVNLAHEETGLIPTEEWKKRRYGQEWIAGETLSCAIGQSYMLTTPLQLANLFAAIGNGGHLWKPYIVKTVETPDGKPIKEPKAESISSASINPKTMEAIKKALVRVVADPIGTAYYRRLPGIDVAGKTGTSQVVRMAPGKVEQKCESMPFKFRDNALFAAFAPPDDPVIAVAVVAEHACHGSSGASPIAMEVIKTYLQKYMPERYSDEAIKARLKQGNLARSIQIKSTLESEEDGVRLNDFVEPHKEPLPDPEGTH